MGSPDAQHVEELLQEPQGNWNGYITSYEECIQMRKKLNAARIVDVDQEENSNDDFPYSAEAKMVCAYQLWEAMVDYSNYIEAKDQKNHFQVDRLKAISEVEMEVLAWELLVAIENAHRGRLGFTVTPPDAADRKPTWHYSSFGTFGARFANVKEACRQSKSIVYNLTMSPFILKLAADPQRELTSKKANKVINDRRAQAKRSAARKEEAPSESGEQVKNGGSSNAGEQPNSQTHGARTVDRPEPKATRFSCQKSNATRSGRITKATGQKGKKLLGSSEVQVAVAGGSNFQGPGPSVPPAVETPQQDRAALYQTLQRPLEHQERDADYQQTVKSLLDKMGYLVN